jgi:hypothetical protein
MNNQILPLLHRTRGQRSYQTLNGWRWECSNGHINNNSQSLCINCSEPISCATAGGHGFQSDSQICDRGTCRRH